MRGCGPRPPPAPRRPVIAPPENARPLTWPTATYRVQLHAGFTFDDAAALGPYLASLGVSHLYCSPVLQAVAGSTHGYDVVDHSRLSEELGGAGGFERLADAMADCGLSLVVDTVPNHMALAGSANRWWWDVLEDGPSSRYAGHFDIEWSGAHEDGAPSVLMPILGDHLGRVIEAGELGLVRRGGSFVVAYHDHEVPLSPRSVDAMLAAAATKSGSAELADIAAGFGELPHAARADSSAIDARHRGKVDLRQRLAALCQLEPAVAAAIDQELTSVAGDPDALEALLGRQNYRLASWRTADDELDYRRFFSIVTLAGLRVEDPEVFEESHRLLADLVARGLVTGLRIDHIDGLRDPAGYLHRLADLVPGAYLVVEKILQPGESLPDGWPVAGTSGYDHLIAVNDLFVDHEREAEMTAWYTAFVGDDRPFEEVVREAKLHVLRGELAAETDRLTNLLSEVCAGLRRHRDHTRRELRETLEEVLIALPAYRTYVVPGQEPSSADRALVAAALAGAAVRRGDLDAELVALLGRVLLLEEPGDVASELAARFQQLSAPVMAKGVEDTAFYRYNRLVSLNEVGGEPGVYGRPPEDFHEHCASLARQWPDTMLTLSTHDTKRSVDVRSRIDLLSELPEAWGAAVERWATHADAHRSPAGPDRATEVLLYQTLVGTWPIDVDRVVATMAKSAKEAKVHTSWTAPDEAYDAAVEGFTRGLLGDQHFVADLERFLAEHRIVERGRVTSLAQAALLTTAPGVPDIYQGTELWDESLVDPDNRRPVDHDLRAKLLDALLDASPEDALAHLDEGGTKLWLLARLLRHRRRHPAAFLGTGYAPLRVAGPKARHAVAFARGDVAVVVPRLLVGLDDDWDGTTVTLPDRSWLDLLGGASHEGGTVELTTLLDRFPLAVLVPEGA